MFAGPKPKQWRAGGIAADGQLEGGRAPQAPSQYLMQLRVTNIAYERR